jgi:rhodanese-related sulfurtransferase
VIPDLTAHELREREMAGTRPPILDVRSRAEFLRGHVPGAVHAPVWSLVLRTRRLPISRHDPIVVYCGHGPRARVARALLRWHGFTRVACLAGHMAGWRAAGLPVASGER